MNTLIKYIIAALIAFAVSTISAGATEDDEYEAQPTVQLPTARNLTIETSEPEVRRATGVVRGVFTEDVWLASNRDLLEAPPYFKNVMLQFGFNEETCKKVSYALIDEAANIPVRSGVHFEILDSFTTQESKYMTSFTMFLVKCSTGEEGWVLARYLEKKAKLVN